MPKNGELKKFDELKNSLKLTVVKTRRLAAHINHIFTIFTIKSVNAIAIR
jgi:hypothetical protein